MTMRSKWEPSDGFPNPPAKSSNGRSPSPLTRITRRQGLLGLFGGSLGLQAFVTGLPAWYLLNPRRATAQDLQCAITARANL